MPQCHEIIIKCPGGLNWKFFVSIAENQQGPIENIWYARPTPDTIKKFIKHKPKDVEPQAPKIQLIQRQIDSNAAARVKTNADFHGYPATGYGEEDAARASLFRLCQDASCSFINPYSNLKPCLLRR